MATRRYVVIGAGAVGGVLVGQLVDAERRDRDVVLVARGDHGRLIAQQGLTVRRPTGAQVVPVSVAAGPDDLRLHEGDVLVLTVKTQDVEAALSQWAWQPVHDEGGSVSGVAADLPLLTFQNGMLSEDLALRRFRTVYGATIAIAASYLTPGEVVSPSLPPAVGAVWLGRYPSGRDALQGQIVDDLVSAGFRAWSVDDIVAHKAAKLVANVANGLDLLTGTDEQLARARVELRDEAVSVLTGAGVSLTTLDFHGVQLEILPVDGHVPGRLSTWQSFARGASSEVDYLNGEIVLLARRAGLAAPLSERLQRMLGAPGPATDRTVEALLAAAVDAVAVPA